MSRSVLLLVLILFGLAPQLASAQRRKPSTPPVDSRLEKYFKSERYQNLIDRKKLASLTPPVSAKKSAVWLESRIDVLRRILVAAKSGTITGAIQPDRWERIPGKKEKDKDKFIATFGDQDHRDLAVEDIEDKILRLEQDKSSIEADAAIVLGGVNLTQTYGYLWQAKLVELLQDGEAIWEINDAKVLITGFDPRNDGKSVPASHPADRGNWFRFSREEWQPGILARNGSKEITIDGKKLTAAVFRFIAPSAIEAEEEKAGKRLLILLDEVYDLHWVDD